MKKLILLTALYLNISFGTVACAERGDSPCASFAHNALLPYIEGVIGGAVTSFAMAIFSATATDTLFKTPARTGIFDTIDSSTILSARLTLLGLTTLATYGTTKYAVSKIVNEKSNRKTKNFYRGMATASGLTCAASVYGMILLMKE